jgi:FkbH-like protein
MDLNIGIDSLVFVDDNPFECELVRENVPEVTVIHLPKDPSRFAGLIRSLPYFDTLTLSAEDRRRSEMYRATASREELRVASGSIDGYLRSLDMELSIGRADGFSIPRIAQLTQKTNQFNLTTRRYSEDQIAKWASDPNWRIYYAAVKDKFDNAGIIAVAMIRYEGTTAVVDSFLMSCRVIGRGIELALMSSISSDCAQRGISKLYGEYLSSAKNQLASLFLSDCGFVREHERGDGGWSIEPGSDVIPMPNWFKTIQKDEEVRI